jgi:hypothetical protein
MVPRKTIRANSVCGQRFLTIPPAFSDLSDDCSRSDRFIRAFAKFSAICLTIAALYHRLSDDLLTPER